MSKFNFAHLLDADPNREPDIQLAMDMGIKASEDALEALGRNACLCTGPVEAGITIMLGAQITYHTMRRKALKQGGLIAECWNRFEKSLGDEANWEGDRLL